MLKHLPEGLTPFADSGFSRYPYLPLADEPVHVKCRLDEGEESPILTMLNGEMEQRLHPVHSENKAGKDYHTFRLGAFPAGSRVQYRFQTAQEKTRWFTFDALTVDSFEEPLGLYQADGVLTFSFAEDFVLKLSTGEGVRFHTAQEKAKGQPCQEWAVSLDGEWSMEGACRTHFWKLKRLSQVIAEGIGFVIYRNAAGTIVKVESKVALSCQYIFGTGERFDCVNQKNRETYGCVVEKYTHQGKQTYLPIPFFFTEQGMGWYRKESIPVQMRFDDVLTMSQETRGTELTCDELFLEAPQKILAVFLRRTGKARLPPDWAFGVWMSGNGWSNDAEVQAQLKAVRRYDYPASVMVLEAWSDERTFYRWNGDGSWKDPKQTLQAIRQAGMHPVLWQIPVIKHQWNGKAGEALTKDIQEAIEKGYVVKSADGTPYRITENWFHHSLLIDFTNPAACKWWFDKRKYLLELGVEGFKTDGGEFLFENTASLYDGSTGLEAHNRYPAIYAQAYHDFMQENGVNGVTFSRAGYVGAQSHPIHWAGDQTSEWSELRAQLVAGISSGLSGVIFWSFDIGGFAGDLPSAQLYLRATAMGCFCPVMQWHAEPRSGQFYNTYPEGFNNDRSPWNLAEKLGDETVLTIACEFARLHEALRGYLVREAKHCVVTGRPMMAHLCVDFPQDEEAWKVDDQYMLGRKYLVAPITEEGAAGRRVYLPKGEWRHFFTKEKRKGPCTFFEPCALDKIPVWERSGDDDRNAH